MKFHTWGPEYHWYWLNYIGLHEMDFLGDGQKWTIYYFLNSVLFQVIVCINIYYFVLKQHLRKNSQTLGWSTNLNLCCVFIVLLRLYLNEEKIYISQWTNHLILNSYAKLVYDKFHRQSLFEYFPVLLKLIIYVFIYKYICMCVWVNFLSGAVMVVIVW